MQIKVLSWNIWTDGYFDQITDFLKTAKADIIGLQEVVSDDPKRGVISFLKNLGYQHVFGPVMKDWGVRILNDGPAIFTKFPILKTEKIVLSKKDPRIAIRADLKVGDQILHVFSTHLVHTHQKESEIQKEQIQTLIKNLASERTIVMGDFNATSQSSTIKSISKVLVDSDPSSKPTWSAYPQGCLACNPQAVNFRLDYIFTTKDLKLNSFKVENSKASDHLPISIILEL